MLLFKDFFFLIWTIFKVFIEFAAAATAKSLQLCPTLCDPIDGSPSGSTVPVFPPLPWGACSSEGGLRSVTK